MANPLPLEVERLEEGGYLVRCPAIRGCHAEGRTLGEAIGNLRGVARVIYDLCQEKGLPFVTGQTGVPAGNLIWQVEFEAEVEGTL